MTDFVPVFDFSAHESVEERQARGRAARKRVARRDQAAWMVAADRREPMTLLADQETTRLPALLPLRYERMGASVFAFYRGSAVVMASDLGAQPNSGLRVQLCGDAHLSNFGLFAAPDRTPVFDLNDFDETNPGPFEWDVKRLAVSFLLAAKDNDLSPESGLCAARTAARQYRLSIAANAQRTEIDNWYERIGTVQLEDFARQAEGAAGVKRVAKVQKRAQARSMWTAVEKLTELVDGHRRFLNAPPLLVRVPPDGTSDEALSTAVQTYRESLADDRRALLERYEVIDVGHKVVGVGSVGLQAWVLLLEGRDANDVLVLQAKQAQQSVLEPYTAPSVYPNSGQRVVEGQRLIQAASDSFLGWSEGVLKRRQFYLRQLRDMKWSPDPSSMSAAQLDRYAGLCGHVLARAHARSGDAIAISSYLGSTDTFDEAIASFSQAYAKTVAADYLDFTAGVASGRFGTGDGGAALETYLASIRSGGTGTLNTDGTIH